MEDSISRSDQSGWGIPLGPVCVRMYTYIVFGPELGENGDFRKIVKHYFQPTFQHFCRILLFSAHILIFSCYFRGNYFRGEVDREN